MRFYSSQLLMIPQRDTVQASGYPLVLTDSTGERLADYTIFGSSGGVGDYDSESGSYIIPMRITGKNLFAYKTFPYSLSNAEVMFDDNGLTLTATANALAGSIVYNLSDVLEPGKEYSISFDSNRSGSTGGGVRVSVDGTTIINSLHFGGGHFESEKFIAGISTSVRLFASSTAGSAGDYAVFSDIQIEEGDATKYEKAAEIKRVILSVPSPIEEGYSINKKADKLPSLPTVKGTTIITAETAVKPSNITADYYKED